LRRAGARKSLFGTDGPWLHPAVEIAKIYALNLNPSDQAWVLGGNLLRVLRRQEQKHVSLNPTGALDAAVTRGV
jgi:predicted TIM-barrel fold metal-dependent hydrolase